MSWTAPDAVRVARLDLGSFALHTPVIVSGEPTPIGHPIERPALSVGADDVVHVAFTSFVGEHGSVCYVDLSGDRSTDPVLISGAPRPETNLVHMTLADDAPALAWLEDATLSVATQADGLPHEVENVDDLTCDCCNPVPVRLGDQLTVAYRNQEHTDDGISYSKSEDDGVHFTPPTLLIPNTPESGLRRAPSAIVHGEQLLVTWIDRTGGHVAAIPL